MKRIIYVIMSMTMMLIVGTQTIQAEKSTVLHRGDTVAVVKGQDTVYLVGSEESLAKQVVNILDDTLAQGLADGSHEAVNVKVDPATAKQREKLVEEMQRSLQAMVVVIVITLVVGVILIILIVEWFKHRRRKEKYEIISKAIDNNYPLNDLMIDDFGNKHMEQPPVFMPHQQASVQPPMPGQAPMNQMNQPPVQPVAGQVNWNAYNSAFTMMAVGIGFMVFFAYAGGWPLIGVFLMVFLIGAFKAFMVWQQQKQSMEMMRQQAQLQQQAQMQQQVQMQQQTPMQQPRTQASAQQPPMPGSPVQPSQPEQPQQNTEQQ
ncbi:MAG: hypothetical protein II683_01520 [Muribaculaceae bacterium]|nr:hypothetical protein [Muribaculaceae bacterium]